MMPLLTKIVNCSFCLFFVVIGWYNRYTERSRMARNGLPLQRKRTVGNIIVLDGWWKTVSVCLFGGQAKLYACFSLLW